MKCDESRPACRNCSSTGRKCDGYGIWSTVPIKKNPGSQVTEIQLNLVQQLGLDQEVRRALSDARTLLTTLKLNQEEQMCFDYFRLKTVVKLPGPFHSHFWETLVLQASICQPAVLHAAVALGSAHKSGDLSFRGSRARPTEQDYSNAKLGQDEVFALQEYTKAISHLRNQPTSNKDISLRVVLITCVLFITLDLLQGEYGTAQTHTESGWKLMDELRSGDAPDDGKKKETLTSDHISHDRKQSVDDSLTDAFSRLSCCLSIQSALFGGKSVNFHRASYPADQTLDLRIPPSFNGMHEARQSFDVLLSEILSLSEDCRSYDLSGTQIPPSLVSRQLCLRSAIASWKVTYTRSRPALLTSCNEYNVMGVPLLRIFLSMASIMTETALCSHQTIFDDYTSHFTSIITQTIDLWKGLKTSDNEFDDKGHYPGLHFIADMGTIPFLYFTALKCRVPWLRRQAITLLLAMPLREGMWDGFIMANIARKIMVLEEGGFYDGVDLGVEAGPTQNPVETNKRLLGSLVPLPEASRFYHVELNMHDPARGIGELVYKRRSSEEDERWVEGVSPFDFSMLERKVILGFDA